MADAPIAPIPWQPTRVFEPQKPIATSMCPTEVTTDVGKAYVKPMWPGRHHNRLARDRAGMLLAHDMGLPTLEHAIHVLLEAETFPLTPSITCLAAPALSRERSA